MKPPSEKIQALAERLKGTCDHATDEIEELTIDECKELDSLVGCCEGCDWWVSRHELNDDWRCEDCTETSVGRDK